MVNKRKTFVFGKFFVGTDCCIAIRYTNRGDKMSADVELYFLINMMIQICVKRDKMNNIQAPKVNSKVNTDQPLISL